MSWAQPVGADERPTLKDRWIRPSTLVNMPPGEILTKGTETLRCYNLDEGKQIALLVNQQRDLFLAAVRWEAQRSVYESKIGGLELRLEAQLGLVAEYKDNVQYYRGLWISTREELHKGPRVEPWKLALWIAPTLMWVVWGVFKVIK